MKEKILKAVENGVQAIEQLHSIANIEFISNVAKCISEAYKNEKKIIIAGNGGSLCDASHFAEELTGQFRKPRAALPAIALNDPGFITCVGNDHGFDSVFSRGVSAYGQRGDVFLGLSTSGNSPNIVNAFEMAKRKNMVSVAFLGKDGGKLKGVADYEMIIDGFKTSDRIQEAHMCAIHVIIEMVEDELFYNKEAFFKNSMTCQISH